MEIEQIVTIIVGVLSLVFLVGMGYTSKFVFNASVKDDKATVDMKQSELNMSKTGIVFFWMILVLNIYKLVVGRT